MGRLSANKTKINRKDKRERFITAKRKGTAWRKNVTATATTTTKEILQQVSKRLSKEDNWLLQRISGVIDSVVRPRSKPKRERASLDSIVQHLINSTTREAANAAVETAKDRKKLLRNTGAYEKIEKLYQEELFHIGFVRKCMDLLIPGSAPNNHDHTKDPLYLFLSACSNFGVEIPQITNYYEQHWRSEPHHEQYEEHTGHEVSDDNIIEMAIDRLSRNLQYNQNTYNEADMEKYFPVFHKDPERKSNLYKSRVEKLKPFVYKQWTENKTLESGQ